MRPSLKNKIQKESSSGRVFTSHAQDLESNTQHHKTNKGKEKVVYVHNRLLFIQKKNEVLSFSTSWIQLEVILIEISQSQKDKHCVVLLI
jgi:hypothetical protein